MKNTKIFLISFILGLATIALTAGLARKSDLIYAKNGLTTTTTSSAVQISQNNGKYYTVGVSLAASNNVVEGDENPTLTVKLQASPNCNDYIDIVTFNELTTGSTYQTSALSDSTTVFYNCWRTVNTVGGTLSSYNVRVELYHD